MGKKLYKETAEGGIKFTSRRMGQVRIANYVYDIWLPILGAKGITVYGVYCRLERAGTVKAITQADLASACRIGVSTLKNINTQLEECGFIKIIRPKGYKRQMHWTIEVEVLDPPREISAVIIEKYQPPKGYRALSTWLVSDDNLPPENLPEPSENPNRISRKPKQDFQENPNRISNIVSLGLYPSDVALEDTALSRAPAPPPFLPLQFSLSVKAVLAEKHTASEWHAISEAEQGRAKPRSSLIQGVERKLNGGGHPAIQAYHAEMGHYPRRNQTTDIIAAVGDNGRLEEWRAVVHAWKLAGWNPYNLGGMIECFTEKRIPGQDRGRGKRGSGKRAPQIPDAAYWKRVQQEQA